MERVGTIGRWLSNIAHSYKCSWGPFGRLRWWRQLDILGAAVFGGPRGWTMSATLGKHTRPDAPRWQRVIFGVPAGCVDCGDLVLTGRPGHCARAAREAAGAPGTWKVFGTIA